MALVAALVFDSYVDEDLLTDHGSAVDDLKPQLVDHQNSPRRDPNTQPFDLESNVLPLRHVVLEINIYFVLLMNP